MTGDTLRELRKQLGLTQAEMANHIGLSLRPYNALEARGAKDIDLKYALASERVGLSFAATQGDIMLAPASVRKDVLALIKALS